METFIGFSGRGEMIPNPDTFCEIDPNVVDKWGIPVLRFHFAWSDHEIKMAKHMQDTFRAHRRSGWGYGRLLRQTRHLGHLRRREKSFTSWERCAWATIQKRRC